MNVIDQAAWLDYETANRRARDEYYAHPSARPRVFGLHYCLACDVLTEQPAACLLCQSRDADLRDLVADGLLAGRLRRYFQYSPTSSVSASQPETAAGRPAVT